MRPGWLRGGLPAFSGAGANATASASATAAAPDWAQPQDPWPPEISGEICCALCCHSATWNYDDDDEVTASGPTWVAVTEIAGIETLI